MEQESTMEEPFRMEEWRGNEERTKTISESLLSLMTIIQSVHSLVTGDKSEGNYSFRRLMKKHRNEETVDRVIGTLMRVHDYAAGELIEMEKRRQRVKRRKEEDDGEKEEEEDERRRKNEREEMKKEEEGEGKKEEEDDWEERTTIRKEHVVRGEENRSVFHRVTKPPLRHHQQTNFAFLNFDNIYAKADQAKTIQQYLYKCGIVVHYSNIYVHHSGRMYSKASDDRIFVSFNIEYDERAIKGLNCLFFLQKCKPVNKMNREIFGSDTSRYVTLVRGLNMYSAFQYDMLSRCTETLLKDHSLSQYSVIINGIRLVFCDRFGGPVEFLNCCDLYRKYPDVYAEQYQEMNESGQQKLNRLMDRLNPQRLAPQ